MPVRPYPTAEPTTAGADRHVQPMRAAVMRHSAESEYAGGLPVGDDLDRARRFCRSARTEMDAILYAERLTDQDPGRDPHWLCERLTLIQHGAKRARARAVYRSAQDAMSLIHCNGPHLPIDWGQVDGRLIILNKLLSQYDAGLEEVEQALALEASAEDATNADASSDETLARPAVANDQTAFDVAANTLSALLPMARPEERQTLGRLIAANTPIDQDAASPTGARATIAPTTTALDAAMPDLVQRLLGHGRVYGKTLSVSYTLDDIWVTAQSERQIVQALWDGLEPRIAADMPLQGVGHIDISPDANETLLVSGSGFAPFTVSLQAAENDQPIRPTPKPRITPDTEADLRAQLSALLDGGGS